MTKLAKVLTFMNRTGSFTWKSFNAKMKCTYPCAETNYLSMLVKAQYVAKVGTGKYEVHIDPSVKMSYGQLKRESDLNWNTK